MQCQLMTKKPPDSKESEIRLMKRWQNTKPNLTRSKPPWISSMTPSIREKSLIDKLLKKKNSDKKMPDKLDLRKN